MLALKSLYREKHGSKMQQKMRAFQQIQNCEEFGWAIRLTRCGLQRGRWKEAGGGGLAISQILIMRGKEINKKGASEKEGGSEEKCLICQKPSRQTRVLIQNLLKRCWEKRENSEEEYQFLRKDQATSLQILFSTTLETVTGFGPKQASPACSHLQIQNHFRRKLRCSRETLNQFCHEILNECASRTYQLDLLLQQFQQIEDRCWQLSRPLSQPVPKVKNQHPTANQFQAEDGHPPHTKAQDELFLSPRFHNNFVIVWPCSFLEPMPSISEK